MALPLTQISLGKKASLLHARLSMCVSAQVALGLSAFEFGWSWRFSVGVGDGKLPVSVEEKNVALLKHKPHNFLIRRTCFHAHLPFQLANTSQTCLGALPSSTS